MRRATDAANADEVEAAGRIIDSFLRKAPLNPDAFSNPALRHHYSLLMAHAFGTPLPAYDDTILPDYALIDERSSAPIQAWNEAISADPRTSAAPAAPSTRPAKPAAAPFDPTREKELREMYRDGVLGRLLVADLRAACAHFGLPSGGKKNELLGVLGAYFATS